MTETKEVLYEVKDRIATITLNRPEKRNSINGGIISGMNHGLDQADQDPGVSAIILIGAGGNFCSGADLGEADLLSSHPFWRFTKTGDIMPGCC